MTRYRGEVALLSRNVVVESADPDGVRGHTMYHRNSAGIDLVRRVPAPGQGRGAGQVQPPLPPVGDTMRGTSVVGASIWDSGNRWITIHGTNYLVVRDCVGYRVGRPRLLPRGRHRGRQHPGRQPGRPGLSAEAVARPGADLRPQRGAGFWWANSRNAFLRNVAVECDQYGFRYDAPANAGVDLTMPVRGAGRIVAAGGYSHSAVSPFPGQRGARSNRDTALTWAAGRAMGRPVGSGASARTSGIRSRSAACASGMLSGRSCPRRPAVLVDGLDVAHCEYASGGPASSGTLIGSISVYHTGWRGLRRSGAAPGGAVPGPLEPTDDRPPFSVMIRVEPDGSRTAARPGHERRRRRVAASASTAGRPGRWPPTSRNGKSRSTSNPPPPGAARVRTRSSPRPSTTPATSSRSHIGCRSPRSPGRRPEHKPANR